MIFDCTQCGKVYSQGKTARCPECGGAQDVLAMANREIERLRPIVIRQHGEGGTLATMATTKEGREFLGWWFVVDANWSCGGRTARLKKTADTDRIGGVAGEILRRFSGFEFDTMRMPDRDQLWISPVSEPDLGVKVGWCVFRELFEYIKKAP